MCDNLSKEAIAWSESCKSALIAVGANPNNPGWVSFSLNSTPDRDTVINCVGILQGACLFRDSSRLHDLVNEGLDLLVELELIGDQDTQT